MKLILSKDVKGISKDHGERLHAKAGDILRILLLNKHGYICDSIYYPNDTIMVFKSQVQGIIKEEDKPLDKLLNAEEMIEDEVCI